MIISRTPFRLSFLGGGTDLPEFYQEEEGAVLSTSLNKYMYVTINDRFDESFRLSYSRTEICTDISKVEHPIFKSVLRRYPRMGRGLEIISMADIPSGTGLGSSSSFTVGLLHALHAHDGHFRSAHQLAEEACDIEINELHEPIGKQDQYAAAFGGLQWIRFLPNGSVVQEPVICPEAVRIGLQASVMMFYTGLTRKASSVLSEQKNNTASKRENLRAMRDLGFRFKKTLETSGSLSDAGNILHEGWLLKKEMASGVSNTQIDQWYERGRKAGAWGGKILGAGGGGFLMLMASPEKQRQIEAELKELRRIPIEFEPWGSRIIFYG